MTTPRQQCLDHAKHCLAGLGTLEQIKSYREVRFYHVVFQLTRVDCVDIYVAFSDGTGVGMTKTHTAPVEALPLFQTSRSSYPDTG
jgi:hypothetical protein